MGTTVGADVAGVGSQGRRVRPSTLDAWQLGPVDLERQGTVTAIDGATALLRGRAHLTVGAAATLHDAITDWLKAEDALDECQGRPVR